MKHSIITKTKSLYSPDDNKKQLKQITQKHRKKSLVIGQKALARKLLSNQMGTLTWYFRNLKRVEQVEGGKETTSKDLKCYESQKKRTLFW